LQILTATQRYPLFLPTQIRLTWTQQELRYTKITKNDSTELFFSSFYVSRYTSITFHWLVNNDRAVFWAMFMFKIQSWSRKEKSSTSERQSVVELFPFELFFHPDWNCLSSLLDLKKKTTIEATLLEKSLPWKETSSTVCIIDFWQT